MILAIDIGNTNIVIGGFENDSISFTARVATDVLRTEEQYAVEIHQILHLYGYSAKEMEGSIISSVVPPLTTVMKTALKQITGKKPMVVGPGLKTGLNIKLDNPASLGADRVADTVAAISEYPLPLLVVDMGTATTMSVINEKEEFIGGAIMPGLRLSLEALSSKASLLPHIDLIPPKSVIGRNTVDANGQRHYLWSSFDARWNDRPHPAGAGTAGAGGRDRRTFQKGDSLLPPFDHPGPESSAQRAAHPVL